LDPRDKTLNIVIVDPNPLRSAILRDGLHEAGYQRITLIDDMHQLARRLNSADPDVILIDLENPSADVLEQVFQISRAVPRPIALFVDKADSFMVEAAVDAGVSAFIVDGLTKSRVRSTLELTISRFNAVASLHRELDQAKSALADRKVIEQAKGIIMKRKGLGEDQAYGLLRQTAMNQNRKVVEVARSIVTAAGLLG
jgi:response regulator NasT